MTQQLHAIPSSFSRIPRTQSPNVSMLVEICTCRIHTKTERHRKSATAVCFATAICFAASNIEHRKSATAVCVVSEDLAMDMLHSISSGSAKSATAVCFATAICFATSNIEHRTSATAVCFATAIRVKPLILFLSLWVWNSWPACIAAHVFLLLGQNISNSCFRFSSSCAIWNLLFLISIQLVVESPWCL